MYKKNKQEVSLWKFLTQYCNVMMVLSEVLLFKSPGLSPDWMWLVAFEVPTSFTC